MKKVFVAVILIALSLTSAFAQDAAPIKTLFGAGPVKHSGFGEFGPNISQIDGTSKLLVGGKGAWLVNNTFYLGLGGYGMVPGIDKTFKNVNDSVINGSLHLGYGGLVIGYNYEPQELIHLSGSVLFGFGGMVAVDKSNADGQMHLSDNYYDDKNNDPWAAFYVIQPEITAEMNVTTFFKLGVTAGYRFAERVDESDTFKKNATLNDVKLNGYTLGLKFMFGCF